VTNGTAPTTEVLTPLACEVTATLRADTSLFEITDETPARQSFLNASSPSITWEWSVVPLRSGTWPLTLVLQPVQLDTSNPSGTEISNGPYRTVSISVAAEQRSVVGRADKTANSFVQNPVVAFVGLGGLTAMAGWIWRRLRKRPKTTPTP
jgi:hypothetical protein